MKKCMVLSFLVASGVFAFSAMVFAQDTVTFKPGEGEVIVREVNVPTDTATYREMEATLRTKENSPALRTVMPMPAAYSQRNNSILKQILKAREEGRTLAALSNGASVENESATAVATGVSITPGSDFASAPNIRDTHVRAAFAPGQTGMSHFYYFDVSQADINNQTAMSLILANFPANADFNMYLLDSDGIDYLQPPVGAGVIEEYTSIGLPRAGRWYIEIEAKSGTGAYDVYAGKYVRTATLTIPLSVSVYVGTASGRNDAISNWVNIDMRSVPTTRAPQNAYLTQNSVLFVESFTPSANPYFTFYKEIKLSTEAASTGWQGQSSSTGNSPVPLQPSVKYWLSSLWNVRAKARVCNNLSWNVNGMTLDLAFPACAANFAFY